MTRGDDDQPLVRTCLVVGTGLIGTSVALALRRHGVTVHLADRDPTAARQAAELGAGTLDPPAEQVDLAVVAVSPSATAEVVSGLLAGNVAATVVDTAAVKDGVLREVAATVGPGPALRRHPPDGRRRALRAGRRARRPVRGPPLGGVARPAPSRARWPGSAPLLELCGAVPVEMAAAAHDAAVALVSHVPQVAASLVAARLAEGEDAALALTGQGLRDVTRVAASDPDLWVDILAANAEPVARILTELRQDVDAVVSALHEVAEDPEWARTSLREVLRAGQRRPGPAARQARRPLHVVRRGAGGPRRPPRRARPAGGGRRRRRGEHRGHPDRALARPAGRAGRAGRRAGRGGGAGRGAGCVSAGSCTPEARSIGGFPTPDPLPRYRMPPSSHDTPDTPSGRRLVVAVDGPSGSGKSSVSREVARRLGLRYLDTGAMYRALTWWALERGADLDDQPEVARLARELPLEIGTTTDSSQLTVDGHDVSAAIREPRISAAVSAVATNLGVRDELVRRQREIAAAGGIVVEGRDITTVVAPDADIRVLLTANEQARLARRALEVHGSDDDDAIEATRDHVVGRDAAGLHGRRLPRGR